MAAIYASLKDVVSIRMKSRHDGFCEQYNRIFMMKGIVLLSLSDVWHGIIILHNPGLCSIFT